jgi:hypothetical protein
MFILLEDYEGDYHLINLDQVAYAKSRGGDWVWNWKSDITITFVNGKDEIVAFKSKDDGANTLVLIDETMRLRK